MDDERDPEVVVRQHFRLAANDPEGFDCAVNELDLQALRECYAQSIYELLGFVQDREPLDIDEAGGVHICNHPSAEMWCLIGTLAADAHADALGRVVAEITLCPACVDTVLLAILRVHASVLNNVFPEWHGTIQNRLLELLDEHRG